MEQKHLSNWLKLILVGVGVCGLVVYALAVPMYGLSLRAQYPEFSNRFWPWLLFIWVSGIPCFMVLYYGWKVSTNIGNDQSFTDQNIGVPVAGYHPSLAAAYKMILEGKVFSDFVLQSVNDI